MTICGTSGSSFWVEDALNACFRGVVTLGPSFLVGAIGWSMALRHVRGKKGSWFRGLRVMEALDWGRVLLFVLSGVVGITTLLYQTEHYDTDRGELAYVDSGLDVLFWTILCPTWLLLEIKLGAGEFAWVRLFALLQTLGEIARLWNDLAGARHDWANSEERRFMRIAGLTRFSIKFVASFLAICFNRDWRRLRKTLREQSENEDDLLQSLIEVENESFATESDADEPSMLDSAENGKEGEEWVRHLKRTGEQHAGLLSRMLFLWLNPLMSTGFSRTLEKTDFCRIRVEDESKDLAEAFATAFHDLRVEKLERLAKTSQVTPQVVEDNGYVRLEDTETDGSSATAQVRLGEESTETGDSNGDASKKEDEEKKDKKVDEGETGDLRLILRALHNAGILRPFYQAALLKLIADSLTYISPQVLKRLIKFLQAEDQPLEEGLGFVGIMLCASVIQSIAQHGYFQLVCRAGQRVRSALITNIYRKSLRLTPSARQARTNGEVVNLMSTDTERINNLFTYLHLCWSSPFQVTVGLIFLWTELRYSVFIAMGLIVVFLTPITVVVAKELDNLQGKLMKLRDARVKVTSEALSSIKVLKMYGWVRSFMQRVIDEREKELAMLRTFAYFIAGAYMCWGATPVLLTLCSFGTYSLIGGTLEPARALTSLSLLQMLEFPLSVLPHVFSGLAEAAVSYRRISSFLESEELDLEVIDQIRRETEMPEDCAILIKDGTFYWDDKREKQALHDVDVKIKEGDLCVLTGEVGSGKSAFLAMLIGELQPAEDPLPKVGISGTVSYAAQVPWIQNATVRDNILFGCAFEEAWYNRVVEACCLLPDFEQLPNGDKCSIGERGINLSGGQKARIALARTVYSRADILLLETCFEAVDEHVGAFLWNKCFKGILLEPHPVTGRKRTVVLITHALKFAHEADTVLVMKNGTVHEQGHYDEIVKDPSSELARLSIRVDKSSRDEKHDGDEAESDGKKKDGEDKEGEKAQGEKAQGEKADAKGGSTEEEEEIAVGEVSWSVYWKYVEAIGGLRVFLVVILVVILRTAMESGTTAWLAYWSDQSSSDGAKKTGFYLGIYAILSVGSLLLISMLVMVVLLVALNASRNMHNNMLDAIFHSPMSFFDTTPLGRVLNRFSKDIYTIDESLPEEILDLFNSAFTVVGAVATIAFVTPQILGVLPVLFLLYWWVQRYYVATSRQLKRWDSVLRSPIYSHFTESLDGLSTIRAFSASTRFSGQNQGQLDKQVSAMYLSYSANRWLAIRLEFLATIMVCSTALFVVLMRESINPAFGGMAVSYSLSITWALGWTVRMIAQLETDAVCVERVTEYMAVKQEAPEDDPDTSKVPAKGEWPSKGEIVLDNVWARYRPGLDHVLQGLSVKINAGEKIGVVGRTGSGKSTMFSLLLRLLEPEKGTVRVDGYDLQHFGLERLRQSCAIIPQDPVMFNTTLRENLDPLKLYSDEEIWSALEHTQLKEYVETSLEKKLDTEISEGGSNFSFGQRQLICIARAILRKCKIILLDEATSGIDNFTDEMIHTTIHREFKNSTVLTIAHRLTTIMDADRIIVMNKGQVAEFAPPQDLLQDENSLFYSLVKQMKRSDQSSQ